MKKFSVILCSVLAACSSLKASPLSDFYNSSLEHIFTNLAHPDIKPGAVIASPSKWAPDYFSHWTRDAALTENALLEAYEVANNEDKARLIEQAKKWIQFEILAQNNSLTAVGGIGEPRFNVDATVVTFPWARPQDDGPAGRALMMMRWAKIFKANGDAAFANSLYKAELPANSIIKRDLEYISHRWQQPSFDIWEEINGTHFFTRIIQLEALKEASTFAVEMNDPQAAQWYALQAELMKKDLSRFIVENRDYISATVNWVGGWNHKKTELDSSVIIATNLGLMNEAFFHENKSYFLNAAKRIEEFFRNEYAINRDNPNVATAIGRYPEDVYTGTTTDGPANAWFITTHAMAEFYCKVSKFERNATRARNLKAKGMKFFERTLLHRNQETNEMSEQYSRHNGNLMGAKSLTWSYASYLTAYLACK